MMKEIEQDVIPELQEAVGTKEQLSQMIESLSTQELANKELEAKIQQLEKDAISNYMVMPNTSSSTYEPPLMNEEYDDSSA